MKLFFVLIFVSFFILFSSCSKNEDSNLNENIIVEDDELIGYENIDFPNRKFMSPVDEDNSGVYFLKISANRTSTTKKIIIE